MLPKKYRLKSEKIPIIAKTGKKISKKGISISFKKKASTSLSNFGFIVSKKVEKSAVKRNRIKRVCRATVSKLIKTNAIAEKGLDVLIMVYTKDIATMEAEELEDILITIFSRINE